ncbi:MAG: hypothetical protein H6735_22910 [Alphaproteobacteria bacterium]|nr:hypothetical protein [Alphaproteobacteria bacterium]
MIGWLAGSAIAASCGMDTDLTVLRDSIANAEQRLASPSLDAAARTELQRRLAMNYGAQANLVEGTADDLDRVRPQADALRRRAMDLWLGLADQPGRAPEALWCVADLGQASGDDAVAIGALRRLIAQAPASPEARDAHLLLGDLLHTTGELRPALLEYLKATSLPWDDPASGGLTSRFRLAQAWWSLDERDRAIETLDRTIQEGLRRGERATGAFPMQLERQLLVRWMAETRGTLEAVKWVRFHLEEPAAQITLIEDLATFAMERGEPEEAVMVSELLVNQDPTDDRVPDWLAALVQGTVVLDAANPAEAVAVTLQASRWLLAVPRPPNVWAEARRDRPEQLGAARRQAGQVVRSAALGWHRRADLLREGGHDAESVYSGVADLYQVWLEAVPEDRSLTTLAKLGDAAWHAGQLERSLTAYDDAIAAYRELEPTEELRAAAREAAVVANELCDRAVRAGRDPVVACRAQLAAADRYVAWFGTADAHALELLVETARVQTARGQAEDAARRWFAVLAAEPSPAIAEEAARQGLAQLATLGRWEEYQRRARQLSRRAEWSPEVRRELSEQFAIAQRRNLEARRAATGDDELYALLLYQWWLHWRDLEDAGAALNDAAVAWDRVGDRGSAVAARRRLVEVEPATERGVRNRLLLADGLVAVGLEAPSDAATFREAAEHYEVWAAARPDDPRAGDALASAALERLRAGDLDRGLSLAGQALGRRASSERRIELLAAVAGACADADRPEDAFRWWSRLVVEPGASPQVRAKAWVGGGRALAANGDVARLRSWVAGAEKMAREPAVPEDLASEMAAEMQLTVLVALRETLDRSTPAHGDAGVAWVALRRPCQEALAAVEAAGSTSTRIRARIVFGQAMERFAQLLEGSTPPERLDERQRGFFFRDRDDRVYVVRSDAIEAWTAASTLAREAGLPVAREAREGLERLDAAPPLDEWLFHPMLSPHRTYTYEVAP